MLKLFLCTCECILMPCEYGCVICACATEKGMEHKTGRNISQLQQETIIIEILAPRISNKNLIFKWIQKKKPMPRQSDEKNNRRGRKQNKKGKFCTFSLPQIFKQIFLDFSLVPLYAWLEQVVQASSIQKKATLQLCIISTE